MLAFQCVQRSTGRLPIILLLLATNIIINCNNHIASSARVVEQNFAENDESQLVLVIDAGSGGNRAILFNVTVLSEFNIVVTEKKRWRSETPLAQFVNGHFDELGPQKLVGFLRDTVFKNFSIASTCSTKLVLAATAGVRMLPSGTRKSLLANTLKALKPLNPNLRKNSVRAITGEEEAMLTWISAHHITGRLNKLNESESADERNSDRTDESSSSSSSSSRLLPVVEVGGVSVQVAVPIMEPDEETKVAAIGERGLAILRLRSWLSLGARATLAHFATGSLSHRISAPNTPCMAAGVVTRFNFRGENVTLIGDNATMDAERYDICKFLATEFVLERNIQRVPGFEADSTVLAVGSLHYLVKHTSKFICEQSGNKGIKCDNDNAFTVGVTVEDLEENARSVCSLGKYRSSWEGRYCILLTVQTALLRAIGLSDRVRLIAVSKAAWPRAMAIETAVAVASL